MGHCYTFTLNTYLVVLYICLGMCKDPTIKLGLDVTDQRIPVVNLGFDACSNSTYLLEFQNLRLHWWSD